MLVFQPPSLSKQPRVLLFEPLTHFLYGSLLSDGTEAEWKAGAIGGAEGINAWNGRDDGRSRYIGNATAWIVETLRCVLSVRPPIPSEQTHGESAHVHHLSSA